jgi:hypothetical protein
MMSEQLKNNDVSGIFITEHDISNMKMERILVSNPAILKILELIKLPKKDQEDAVDNLVSRTPDWMDLEPEVQIQKIKVVLTTETILYYLTGIETIRKDCDLVEVGVDEEGSVVVYAYYVDMSRVQRREMIKKTSKKDKEKIKATASELDRLAEQGNIIDLAKKKMERLAKEKEAKGE